VLPSLVTREVDVFVVDAPRVASVALGSARADAESTYVLCRHLDETSSDFMRRVQRRLERIARTCCIHSLSYIIGPEAARGRSAVPLLGQLMPMLAEGANLTVAGPGSHGKIVFEWIEALQRLPVAVTVRARLYDDGHEGSVFARSGHAPSLEPSASHGQAERAPASRPRVSLARTGKWFPMEIAAGYPPPGVGLPSGS
jgi:hypothetical protein